MINFYIRYMTSFRIRIMVVKFKLSPYIKPVNVLGKCVFKL